MTHTDDTWQATAHTPEPWHYQMDYSIWTIAAPDPTGQNPYGAYIAEIDGQDVGRFATCEQHDANARRICAAVNACKGISTEAMEQGVVRQLMEALEDLYNWLTPDWQQSSLGDKARTAIAKGAGRPA